MNKMAILVNSCDAYSDIWDLYFDVFRKQWEDCPYDIYLNTETKKYENKFIDVKVLNLPDGIDNAAQITWSERLHYCLERIDATLVLSTLDDILFLKQINTEDVESLLKKIHGIKNFAMLSCYNLGPKYWNPKLNLYRCHRFCEFNYNITCNLWNRKNLMRLLSFGEDVWSAEMGIKRRMEVGGGQIYCLPSNGIFQFDVRKHGLIHGKWAPETESFAKSLGITWDFSQRKMFEENLSEENLQNINLWEKRISEVEKYSKRPYFCYTLKNWRKVIKNIIRRNDVKGKRNQ